MEGSDRGPYDGTIHYCLRVGEEILSHARSPTVPSSVEHEAGAPTTQPRGFDAFNTSLLIHTSDF